jgi:hypothetical protein
MSSEQTWAVIGQIVAAGGGGAIIAFSIFAFLGKRWIESQFEKRLEEFRSRQNQELEKYKAKIGALFNKITKIHEKEFKILPEAWYKLQNVMGKTSVVSAIFKEYPDVNLIDENDLEHWLTVQGISEIQKKKILSAERIKRNEVYQDALFWKQLEDAFKEVYDLHNYLLFNKIFLSKDLFDAFDAIDKRIIDILSDLRYSKEGREHSMYTKALDKFRKFPREDIDKLEKLVQKRLHYSDAKKI